MKLGALTFWAVLVAAAIWRVAASFDVSVPDVGPCLGETTIGTGRVSSDPERKGTGQAFFIKGDLSLASSSLPCAEGLIVKVKARPYPRFMYGDEVVFSGKLLAPSNFSSGGRTFDYRGYLAKDGAYHEMKSAAVELASSTAASHSGLGIAGKVARALLSVKRAFVASLERALGEPHAALAAGLVVGEKSALGADLLDDFRTVGLIHIVVLSGFNITIVGVALRRALSRLPRVWGIAIGAAGIVVFGVLVGGGATVVRSCFMAVVAMVGDLIRRDYSVHRALAFAGLVMLIQNPMVLLHDPSFQLSFLATVGLILLSEPIEKWLGWVPEALGLRGTVAACLATQIFVAPFILQMMGQLSLISLVANVLVLPVIPATMLAVFMTGIAGFVSAALSGPIGLVPHFLLSYELFVVEKLAGVPYAALEVPPFPAWATAAVYAAFALVRLSSMALQFRLAKKSSM